MRAIRPARPADLPGAYRVCLLTGDAGGDGTPLYRNPELLGHVFVGPYVVGAPATALVVADPDGIAGYCLAVSDTRRFEAWCEEAWWPLLRAQYPWTDAVTHDGELIRLLHDPPRAPDDVVADYPAHLHIDLLERVRGIGLGRRLVERQLEALRAQGVRGLHLDVAAANANAIAFYAHLGFHRVHEDEGSLLLGIRLGGEPP